MKSLIFRHQGVNNQKIELLEDRRILKYLTSGGQFSRLMKAINLVLKLLEDNNTKFGCWRT